MKNLTKLALSLSVAGLLASCGGDDDGVEIAKYLGTWARCSATGVATSEKETFVITEGSGDTLVVADTHIAYGAPACAGPGGIPDTTTQNISFNGTKVIGTDTVDRVFVGLGGLGRKQVLLVKGISPVTLTTGRDSSEGGTLDSDGYPTTLESSSLTKQ
jgi:hypothetical protein